MSLHTHHEEGEECWSDDSPSLAHSESGSDFGEDDENANLGWNAHMNKDDAPALCHAARSGDVNALKDLLTGSNGAPTLHPDDESQRGQLGDTALHWAAIRRNPDCLTLLSEHTADIDICDLLGNTPLHWATRSGSQPCAEALMDLGSNVHASNKSERTPLDDAKSSGLKALLARSPEVPRLRMLFAKERDKHLEEVQALQTAIEERDARLDDLTQQVESVDERIDARVAEAVAAGEATAEKIANDQEARNQELSAVLERERAGRADSEKALAAALASSQAAIESADKTAERGEVLAAEAAALRTELQAAREQAARDVASAREATERAEALLSSDQAGSSAALEGAQRRATEAEGQLQELRETHGETERELAIAKAEAKASGDALAAANSRIEQLIAENSSLKAELASLRDQNGSQLRQAQDMAQAAESRLATLQAETTRTIARLETKADESAALLERERRSFEDRLENAVRDAATASKGSDELVTLRTELELVRRQAAESAASPREITDLRDRLQSEKEQREDLQKALSDALDHGAMALQLAETSIKEEARSTAAKLARAEDRVEHAEAEQRRLRRLVEAADARVSKVETEGRDSMVNLMALEGQLDEARLDAAAAIAKCKSMAAELATVHDEHRRHGSGGRHGDDRDRDFAERERGAHREEIDRLQEAHAEAMAIAHEEVDSLREASVRQMALRAEELARMRESYEVQIAQSRAEVQRQIDATNVQETSHRLEVNRLQKALTAAEGKGSVGYDTQMASAAAELSTVRDTLSRRTAELETHVSQLQQELRQAQSDASAYSAESSALRQQLEVEAGQDSAQLQRLRDEVGNMKNKMAAAVEESAEAQRDAKSVAQSLRLELNMASEQATRAQTEASALRTEKSKLATDKSKLEQEISSLRHEVLSMKKHTDDLQRELTAAKRVADDAVSAKGSMDATNQDLNSQVMNLRLQAAEAQLLKDELEDVLKFQQKATQAHERELADVRRVCQGEIDALSQECSILLRRADALSQDHNAELDRQAHQHKARVVELESSLRSAKSELERYETQTPMLQHEINQLRGELDRLSSELNNRTGHGPSPSTATTAASTPAQAQPPMSASHSTGATVPSLPLHLLPQQNDSSPNQQQQQQQQQQQGGSPSAGFPLFPREAHNQSTSALSSSVSRSSGNASDQGRPASWSLNARALERAQQERDIERRNFVRNERLTSPVITESSQTHSDNMGIVPRTASNASSTWSSRAFNSAEHSSTRSSFSPGWSTSRDSSRTDNLAPSGSLSARGPQDKPYGPGSRGVFGDFSQVGTTAGDIYTGKSMDYHSRSTSSAYGLVLDSGRSYDAAAAAAAARSNGRGGFVDTDSRSLTTPTGTPQQTVARNLFDANMGKATQC